MARTMPPLRVPCCQPRCSGKLANGKREFATSIFTTVSADARVIAHLCQSLHCCAARHTRQPLKALGSSHLWWTPWHTVSDARPLHEHVRWDHHASQRQAPEHVGVYPAPITMPTERVLLLHRIVLGGPCASATWCQVVGSVEGGHPGWIESASNSGASSSRCAPGIVFRIA